MFFISAALPIGLVLGVFLLAVDSASAAVQVLVGTCAISLVLSAWFIAACGEFSKEPVSLENTRKIKAAAFGMFGVQILMLVVMWVPQILIGMFALAEDVALFATAQRTAMLTSFVLIAVNAISAPNFAGMHAAGEHDKLRRMARNTSRLLFLIGVPAIGFMLLFPRFLMGLFGTEFITAAPLLMILALGQFVNLMTGSVGYLLQTTGHERLLRFNMAVSATILLIGGLIFIPMYGVLAAAIVTAIAVATQNLLGVWQVKRVLGFNTLAIWRD